MGSREYGNSGTLGLCIWPDFSRVSGRGRFREASEIDVLDSCGRGDGEALELCSTLKSTAARLSIALGECEESALEVESSQLPGKGVEDEG